MSKTETDPRRARTLGDAAQNPDGTFNGARALSWLSEALNPGHGASEAEVQKAFDQVQAKRRTERHG